MTKPFVISIAVHAAIILALINFFSVSHQKKDTSKIKKISLKHIVLKKESVKKSPVVSEKKEEKPKKTEKPKKKSPVKKVKKKKIKKLVKRKKPIKKRKKIAKKIPKPLPKKTETFKRPTPAAPSPEPTVQKISKKTETKTAFEPPSQTVVKSPKKDYIKLNISKIYRAIERAKRYPKIAKKLKIQGVVSVSFTILPNGSVTDIKTSGAHKILQKSAYKTIREASAEFPKPDEKTKVKLKIKYILE